MEQRCLHLRLSIPQVRHSKSLESLRRLGHSGCNSGLVMRFVLAALVLTGCSEFPTRSEAFVCQTDNDCDSARSCEQGFCVIGGRAGGGGPDAAVDEVDAAPEVDAPPPVDPFAQIAMQCMAQGYTLDATTGGYYRVVNTSIGWNAAQADCKNDVANATHLIVLSSQAEVTFLAGRTGGNGNWVGLLDNDTNVFVNVTGEPGDLRPFASGQPDNGSGNENCVQMKDDGRLDDDQCGESHRYVCECDGKMSTP